MLSPAGVTINNQSIFTAPSVEKNYEKESQILHLTILQEREMM